MKVREYIYDKLQLLSDQFPEIHIKYGFDTLIDTHIIELLPVSEYYTNKNLDDAWIAISEEFFEKYPEDEIAFISSDSSLSISKFIFEFKPRIKYQEDKLLSRFFGLMNENIPSSVFPTTGFPRTITTTTTIVNCNGNLPYLKSENKLENNSDCTSSDHSIIAFAA